MSLTDLFAFLTTELSWTVRLLQAGALLVVLEIVHPLLARRGMPLRWLWHTWAILLALLVCGRGLLHPGLALGARIAASGLSGLVVFSLLDAFVLARPSSIRPGPRLPRLARDVVRFAFVASFALLATAGSGEDPLRAVLVSSTVVSAVVGLALQDVLKNVFAGLALDLEKPFQRGDWLLLDGVIPVEVVDMTWRSTWLRTREGVDIFEPNANMNTSRLTNYGAGTRPVALMLDVGLPFDLPPAEARAAILEAAAQAPLVVQNPPPEAFLERFSDSTMVYNLRVWTRGVGQLSRFRDEVYSRVWYELNRRSITIPFPVRTVQLHEFASEQAEHAAKRHAEIAARLATVPLFAGLEDKSRLDLARLVRRELWETGDALVREGEPGASLYLVVHGKLVAEHSHGEDDVVLGELGPGDFFGESSLLTGEPRSATVRAIAPSEVLELDHQALAPLLQSNPTIADQLSRSLAERRDRTQASLASEAPGITPLDDDADSLLTRVRAFFRLD